MELEEYEMDLNYKRLTFSELERITLNLERNSTVWKLVLCGNFIGQQESVLLKNLLIENRVLEYLDLSSNSLKDKGATELALGLSQNSTLKDLILRYNGIRNIGIGEILKAAKYVEYLDLSNNRIDPNDQIFWNIEKLVSENSKLRVLKIECFFQQSSTRCLALRLFRKKFKAYKLFCESAGNSLSLLQLNLSKNLFFSNGYNFVQFSKFMSLNQTIKVLCLDSINLESKTKPLVSIIGNCKSLLALSLINTRISRDQIFKAISRSSIEYLDVSRNPLNSNSIRFLSEATLISLIIKHVNLNSSDANLLSKMNVESLILSHNLITMDGALEIFSNIQDNVNLRFFDISWNNLPPLELDKHAYLLYSNFSLEQLSISYIFEQSPVNNTSKLYEFCERNKKIKNFLNRMEICRFVQLKPQFEAQILYSIFSMIQ